jgi:hypothetical protein
MRICLSLLLLPLLMSSGCGTATQSLSLEDVSQPARIVLSKQSHQGDIHRLSVVGSGKIIGEATLTLYLGDEPYRHELLANEVGFSWEGDWYADTAELVYAPTNVTGGTLHLSYTFGDL